MPILVRVILALMILSLYACSKTNEEELPNPQRQEEVPNPMKPGFNS